MATKISKWRSKGHKGGWKREPIGRQTKSTPATSVLKNITTSKIFSAILDMSAAMSRDSGVRTAIFAPNNHRQFILTSEKNILIFLSVTLISSHKFLQVIKTDQTNHCDQRAPNLYRFLINSYYWYKSVVTTDYFFKNFIGCFLENL